MGKCQCGRLKGNPCGPLRPNTINVTMPNQHRSGDPQPGSRSDGGELPVDERGRRARRGRDPSGGQRQETRFIEEVFTRTDTSDFAGSVRCTAPGRFTGVAVEFDAGNRIFTTLPVVPVQR